MLLASAELPTLIVVMSGMFQVTLIAKDWIDVLDHLELEVLDLPFETLHAVFSALLVPIVHWSDRILSPCNDEEVEPFGLAPVSFHSLNCRNSVKEELLEDLLKHF